MGRLLYKIADTFIFVLCVPFYVVAVPLIALHQTTAVRMRKVRLGQRVRRWLRPDVQEELRVVDVSRLADGLVGVQRRTWDVRYAEKLPEFPDAVEFCTIGEFWFGTSGMFRGGT